MGCSPRGLKGSDRTERLHSLHSCNLCPGFMRTEWYLLDFFSVQEPNMYLQFYISCFSLKSCNFLHNIFFTVLDTFILACL